MLLFVAFLLSGVARLVAIVLISKLVKVNYSLVVN